MPQVNFTFNQDDDGLQLTAVANFPRQLSVSNFRVAGLAEWRHIGANVVTFNQEALEALGVTAKAKNLSKVGVSFNGLKARSHILLAYNTRKGRNGAENVKKLLTKTLKALGATSVKFTSTGARALAPAAVMNDDDWDHVG